MGRPVKGDVVTVPFPFSNLAGSKKRPALVVATLRGDDVILCQITSQAYGDPYSIIIQPFDFLKGALARTSFIRPGKIFTAETSIIAGIVGHISDEKLDEVITGIHEIMNSP